MRDIWVGTFHGFGLDDQCNPQVHSGEGVEVDFRRQRILGQLAIAGRGGFAGRARIRVSVIRASLRANSGACSTYRAGSGSR